MSSIASNSEDLILNADGGSSEVKFKIDGTEKASISSAGLFTSTTIDATKLTGDLPAISGANLTGVGVAGISSSADATAMTIDSNEHIGIGIAPKIIAGGSRYLTVGTQTAGQAGFLELVGNRTANAGQDTAIMKFINNTTEIAEIGAYDNGSTNGGDLKFRTSSGGTASTQLEITSDGRGLSKFTAFAWCNIGLDNVAAGNSNPGGALNISTVTLQSTGVARFNYTNASSSNNVAAVTVGNTAGGTANWNGSTSSYIEFSYYHSNGNVINASGVNMVSFGGN